MRKISSLLVVAIIGGAAALGLQKLIPTNENEGIEITTGDNNTSKFQPVNMPAYASADLGMNADFTVAAEKSVNAVVHVKNVSTYRRPQNYMDYLRNGAQLEKAIVGAGSGVIISADGYIVTNNHVIKGASEVKITMNNGKTYDTKVIGADPNADIALLKIDVGDEELSYLPFGHHGMDRLTLYLHSYASRSDGVP